MDFSLSTPPADQLGGALDQSVWTRDWLSEVTQKVGSIGLSWYHSESKRLIGFGDLQNFVEYYEQKRLGAG